MQKGSTYASLVKRIHGQCFQEQREMFLYHLRLIFAQLFMSIALLTIFQCFNRMYNYWNGPFSMNLKQFQEHLGTNYNAHGYKALFSFCPVLFQPEYLQVELGVGTIELKSMKAYSKYSDPPTQGILLRIFDQVAESAIDKSRMTLYVTFPAYGGPYSKYRYPYRFKSFSIQTLRCIVKQVGIPPKEFLSWSEKEIYVKTIEEIYNRNASLFNEKVIKKCGILLGYLFYPWEEDIYKVDEYIGYQLEENVRVFNAAWYYTAHGSHVFTVLLISIFLSNISSVLSYTFLPLLRLPSKSMHTCIEKELMKLDGISSEDFSILLLETSAENNYYDSMYIVNDKYLIMLMIDFDEESPEILQQFYSKSPFIIIDIDTITEVLPACIVISNNDSTSNISFPLNTRHHYRDRADWLHTRLMILSSQYRYLYEEAALREEEEQHRHLQRMIEAERWYRLQQLIQEETEHQMHEYRNDISRRFQGTTSASPRIIAEYRMNGPLIISDDLRFENCVICIQDFQVDRSYARWPCPAQHLFHFTCMIGVLRTGNKCPICRHPVEALDLSPINLFSWFMPRRALNNV